MDWAYTFKIPMTVMLAILLALAIVCLVLSGVLMVTTFSAKKGMDAIRDGNEAESWSDVRPSICLVPPIFTLEKSSKQNLKSSPWTYFFSVARKVAASIHLRPCQRPHHDLHARLPGRPQGLDLPSSGTRVATFLHTTPNAHHTLLFFLGATAMYFFVQCGLGHFALTGSMILS